MNYEKPAISSGLNITRSIREEILLVLGVKEVPCHEKYLGLPTELKNEKRSSFQLIWKRCMKRLSGWMKRVLCKAGKEVLLKSIHQAILIHPMSLFKLPNNLTTELENMVARFWWSKVFTGLHGVSYVSLKGTGGRFGIL